MSPFMAPQAMAQPMNPPSISGQQVPGKVANEQGEIYNFSGLATNTLDRTQVIGGASVTLTSDTGHTYGPYTTRPDGTCDTGDIDTYVKERKPVDLGKAAVSHMFSNPGGDRVGFYLNLPNPTDVKLKVINARGETIDDALVEPMGGFMNPGTYFQEVKVDGPNGWYGVMVNTGEGDKLIPFIHLYTSSKSFRNISWSSE
jgi:hypothetical protein